VSSCAVAASTSGPSVVLGLRERKRRETRDRLIDAAIELATLHGFDTVTVDQISERADVSPRTFFNYFRCKEAAVLGADGEILEQLRASITAAPGEAAIPVLRGALIRLAGLFAVDAGRWRARIALMEASPELVAYHLRDLAAAESALASALIERDPAMPPRSAVLAVRLGTGALRTALSDWADRGDGDPVEPGRELAAVMADVFDDAAALFSAR
jgi:AcrR family transcriptional regulator